MPLTKEPFYINTDKLPLTNVVMITDDLQLAKNIHKYFEMTCLYVDIEEITKNKRVLSYIYDIIKIFENYCDEYILFASEENAMSLLPLLCLPIRVINNAYNNQNNNQNSENKKGKKRLQKEVNKVEQNIE